MHKSIITLYTNIRITQNLNLRKKISQYWLSAFWGVKHPTADLYIEKTAHVLAKKYRVTVATSDAVEQIIIFGAGAFRMSAQMLLEEIIFTEKEMRERYGIGTDE